MPTATAKLSDYRQSPRKVRLVANLLKGKTVEVALVELNSRAKRSAPVFAKLLKSAMANAKLSGMNEKTLIVKDVRVDKGPVVKRFMPRAQGRAGRILKRSSHIAITLSDTVVSKQPPVSSKSTRTKK